jgi:hypothetical protein
MAERKPTGRKSGAGSGGSRAKASRSKGTSGSKSAPRSKTAARSKTTAKAKAPTKAKAAPKAKATPPVREKEERILGTAPSSPDIRKLHLMEPSEEAKAHVPSEVDAMGKDKRRAVVGHSYGPSRRSQILFFVAVGAIIAILVGGYSAAISAFDQPPDEYSDKAPWSQGTADQIPTRSPSTPCGEPGNPFPPPQDSPCIKRPGGGSVD